MHPVAKKCVTVAILMFIVGAVLLTWAVDIYLAIAEAAGANAEPGLAVVSLLLTVLQWSLMPTAAALIGAAVVIQTLSPQPAYREPSGDSWETHE